MFQNAKLALSGERSHPWTSDLFFYSGGGGVPFGYAAAAVAG
jgi:hypothetical protein